MAPDEEYETDPKIESKLIRKKVGMRVMHPSGISSGVMRALEAGRLQYTVPKKGEDYASELVKAKKETSSHDMPDRHQLQLNAKRTEE
jgi:hypothetical protein